MLKRCVLLISCMITNVFAIVPVDTSLDTANSAAMLNYYPSVVSTLSKIGQSMQIVDQMQSLQGMQKLSVGTSICRLCQPSDQAQLQSYATSINDDLCSQFSMAYQNLTGVQNAAKSLGDIMTMLTVNPKAALMSLQQAAVAAQSTTNSTLAQMQLMQAQMIQKSLADDKVMNQSAQSISDGMKNPGL